MRGAAHLVISSASEGEGCDKLEVELANRHNY